MDCIHQTKPQTFQINGDADKFIKQVVKMLYDADMEDVVFKNGNNRDIRKENVWVKCIA